MMRAITMGWMLANPELFAIVSLVLLLAVLVLIAAMVLLPHLRASRRLGYASLGDYLRAAPLSDEEKRDAVDLTLKGVVLCLLGLVFAPLLLVGLVPLFFGARKMAYGSLGLGLVDDAHHPEG